MKKRNSTLIINLDAIRHNISVLQSKHSDSTKSMAVVKANAYGHGVVPMARAVSQQVDWFAVNDIDEAVELRSSGITEPILVFGVPDEETASLYVQHDITATISALEHFEILSDGTSYHLNFDTGMNRLGFRYEQVEQVKQKLENHPPINCTGIYSHFATADEPTSSKPGHQLAAFKEIRDAFSPALITHMSNTAATAAVPGAHFNMVRLGIGMYGYPPGEIEIPELQPAMQWKTRLVQINPITKGETVSYGAKWKATEDGYIGIIPVGYSDGIPRLLSGKMQVEIEEKSYPVVGTITMNYCMVDLGTRAVPVNTEVELWNKAFTAADWANMTDTIPYEITTALPPDIPREYINEIGS